METLAFLHACMVYEQPEPQPRSLKELSSSVPHAALLGLSGSAVVVSAIAVAPDAHATLQYRDTCPAVQTVQTTLQQMGYDPGPIDGIFGGKTEDAIIHFQKARKLQSDGVVGPETATVLGLNPDIDCSSSGDRPEVSEGDEQGTVVAFPPEAQATHLVIRRDERKLYVYHHEATLASYPVAVGRPGWETPIGSFQITTMLKHPSWTHPFTREVIPPGSENPLGDMWVGFWTNGEIDIGFHGTPDRESVGRAISHGCIRMYNEDIRELSEQIAVGIPVIIE